MTPLAQTSGSTLTDMQRNFYGRFRPVPVSQLAEMAHPNRLFLSASEGQQCGVDFDGSHISNDWLIQW
jgi:hypothetical protein